MLEAIGWFAIGAFCGVVVTAIFFVGTEEVDDGWPD